VYDNTGAHTDKISLESTLFPRFMETEVTRIDWVSFFALSTRWLHMCPILFTFGDGFLSIALAGLQQQYP
jgi:hypothetical protein